MPPPHVAYVTAGAAGMYCGSCLRDNALVIGLGRLGVDATLVPLYTPIRTDETDVSVDRVFFGGINVYLQQQIPLFRRLPARLDRWLNHPRVVRWLARDGGTPSPRILGEMTLSMLRGTHGHQRKEAAVLLAWLRDELRPDIINFSNLLIAGSAADIKRQLGVPILVTLQGDDLFLDMLTRDDRRHATELMRQAAEHVDAFVVFSDFYADRMQRDLGLPAEKFRRVPLGINVDDFRHLPPYPPAVDRPPTIGYLARLAPEKGLHQLVDAFIEFSRAGFGPARLLLAGWLGKSQRRFAEAQFARLRAAGLGDSFAYVGQVDRRQKLEFLASIDLLSVPTLNEDPKGLYVLEALAAGVPVVQPAHGAFPELLASTGGGRLVEPHDPARLAAEWRNLLVDEPARRQLGLTGRQNVLERHSAEASARATLEVYREFLPERTVA